MIAATEQGQDLDTARVEYRVLGPLTAFSDGTRLGLGGRRQRMVLAVLLAHANRIISQDALIDAVWEGVMPESGARSLHSYVSVLRKALGGGIERVGDGYVINVQPEHLDALQFEVLMAEGRPLAHADPARAAQLLRQGLGLWTGSAYGELGHEPALRGEAVRLAKERISALELRFEVDLMLGRHEQIIPEIEALLGEEPYREHLAGILMISLYRSRRQAEALRVYAGMRERLLEELGIDPGQELQDLEMKILERDPDLAAASIDLDTAEEVHGARGYEVHEPIGRTGFGERFRGFHGTMAREVSVLVIDTDVADERGFVRNFEAEMQTVAQLEHPHLAPVLDYWRDPEHAYVITPFYRGGTLETAVAHGPPSLAAALHIADQLAAALGSLHRQGQCHGAITTGSVFLDEEHNAYLTDTGLAEARDRTAIEVADDVFQLGALVYETLTGRGPGDGEGLDRIRGDLPSELGHAISRALHPQPELRYQRIEDFARALRQSAGLDVMVATADVADVDRRNPYKGLRAFQESDAADFHGRDALVEEMVDALTESRLVAVVGPSGSGKSSAVRAGLLPRLRNGAVSGSADWLITDMFPGTHPFETLAASLLRVATTRPAALYETLTADPRGLSIIVDELLKPSGSETLLVIDQFEELFSLVNSPSDRRKFLDALMAAAEMSRLRIVLTLRADFFDQPLQYPEFAEIFRSNVVAVSPPTRDGLARAISQPALTAGVSLEPGLVTQIIDDVREQPGGLPLLQFALTDLFARRKGDLLTLDSYNESGGVGGALATRAEETYASLSPQGKEAARQLFLRLVTVDELADDTRRRVRQSELHGLDIDHQVMTQVLQQFGALRFLSFDRDPASRTPTVELAHEALLREWQRLKTWIDERREDLLIHRRIQITVQDWRESGDDRSYLLRGARLEQALTWQERTDIAITEEEMSLIEASIETERVELAEREALEAKAAHRRKAIIGVLAGGLVVAGVLGAVALERSQDARITAAEATARDLSAAAMDAIAEDPELGVLLSLAAMDATESVDLEPVPEAASALRTSLAEVRIEARFPTGYQAIAYSRDGDAVITDDATNPAALHLFDAETAEVIASWEPDDPDQFAGTEIFSIVAAPDDDRLVVSWSGAGDEAGTSRLDAGSGPAGDEMVALSVHNPDTLVLERTLMGPIGGYGPVSLDETGLVSATSEGRSYVWDLETGEVVYVHEPNQYVLSSAFLPGTGLIVATLEGAAGGRGRITMFDPTTSAEVWGAATPGSIPYVLSVSPDGTTLGVGDAERRIQIWDVESRQLILDTEHQDPQVLSWSADSSRLAVSGNDGDITILERDSGWEPSLTLTGHSASVWSTSFHPVEDLLASVSIDSDARVWSLSKAGATDDDAIDVGAPVGLIFFGPTDRMAAGVYGEGVQTFDLDSGARRRTLGIASPFHYSPSESLGAVVGDQADDGPGVLVDANTGEMIRIFPDCLSPKAVSPDERLVVLDSVSLCARRQADAPSHVLDMETDRVLIDLGPREVFKAVFSPTGTVDGLRYVVVNMDFVSIEVYSLEDRKLVASYSLDELGAESFLVLSLDPEGRYLGIGGNQSNPLVIDMVKVMSGEPKMEAVVFDLQAHSGSVPQVRVTSDGLVASAPFDGVYRVWDIASQELLFEIPVRGLSDQGAAEFTWDGTQLAYEDADGLIRFTPIDNAEVVAKAHAAVTRELTADECRRFHIDRCAAGE